MNLVYIYQYTDRCILLELWLRGDLEKYGALPQAPPKRGVRPPLSGRSVRQGETPWTPPEKGWSFYRMRREKRLVVFEQFSVQHRHNSPDHSWPTGHE